jgi:carbon-monoxide dehydrogenase small subunit/xanthine dehydrogenase YagT iron-sulfur-binding subunit
MRGGEAQAMALPSIPHGPNLSRRFVLGGAAATLVAPEGLDSAKAEDAPAAAKPDVASITLNVNGVDHALSIGTDATLAEVLRNRLGLTGTKIACYRGACSACTVWLDGAPIPSCMMLAVEVGARKVRTIEGLADGEKLHPVQQAFIDHDAMQCGYCTPGMAMAAAALIERNPDPTAADVEAAISGHLCRCGTYPHVVAATLAAARAGKG